MAHFLLLLFHHCYLYLELPNFGMRLNKHKECVGLFHFKNYCLKKEISVIYFHKQVTKGLQILPNLLAALEPRLLHLAFQYFYLAMSMILKMRPCKQLRTGTDPTMQIKRPWLLTS